MNKFLFVFLVIFSLSFYNVYAVDYVIKDYGKPLYISGFESKDLYYIWFTYPGNHAANGENTSCYGYLIWKKDSTATFTINSDIGNQLDITVSGFYFKHSGYSYTYFNKNVFPYGWATAPPTSSSAAQKFSFYKDPLMNQNTILYTNYPGLNSGMWSGIVPDTGTGTDPGGDTGTGKDYTSALSSIKSSLDGIGSSVKEIINNQVLFSEKLDAYFKILTENYLEKILAELISFHKDFLNFSNDSLNLLNKNFNVDLSGLVTKNDTIIEKLNNILLSMSTLDRDDDYPILYSIRATLQTMLERIPDMSVLNQYLPLLQNLEKLNNLDKLFIQDGGIDKIIFAIKQADRSDLMSQTNTYLQGIYRVINDIPESPFGNSISSIANSIGDIKVTLDSNIKDLGDNLVGTSLKLDDLIAKLNDLISLLLGSQQGLEDSITNMENAFNNLMNKDIFHVSDGLRGELNNINSNFVTGNLPKLSATVIPGHAPLVIFSLDDWVWLIDIIRNLLKAILYLSLFIYFIKFFVPKLKV